MFLRANRLRVSVAMILFGALASACAPPNAEEEERSTESHLGLDDLKKAKQAWDAAKGLRDKVGDAQKGAGQIDPETGDIIVGQPCSEAPGALGMICSGGKWIKAGKDWAENDMRQGEENQRKLEAGGTPCPDRAGPNGSVIPATVVGPGESCPGASDDGSNADSQDRGGAGDNADTVSDSGDTGDTRSNSGDTGDTGSNPGESSDESS